MNEVGGLDIYMILKFDILIKCMSMFVFWIRNLKFVGKVVIVEKIFFVKLVFKNIIIVLKF